MSWGFDIAQQGGAAPYVEGALLRWIDNTHVGVGVGRVPTVDGKYVMRLLAEQVIDFGANGIGGLDTGAVAAATCYAVYVARQPGGNVGVIASAVFAQDGTGVTLPAAWAGSKLRYVGHVHTLAAAATIHAFRAWANLSSRSYIPLVFDASQTLMSGGTATVATDIDGSKIVSPYTVTAQGNGVLTALASATATINFGESVAQGASQAGYGLIASATALSGVVWYAFVPFLAAHCAYKNAANTTSSFVLKTWTELL
jgi:hypothetical protein